MNTYIFDFDGTLVDSMPYWARVMKDFLDSENAKYPSDIIKIITPLGLLGTVEYFRDVLGVELEIDDMLKIIDENLYYYYKDVIPLKNGVFEYLSHLKKQGKSINVLTASRHKVVDICLKRLGIFDLFDNVWSCDDFNISKSNPLIYKEAVKRLDTKICDTVFFDDNIVAVKSAKEAGLKTVGVYDDTGADFKDELEKISDMYINSYCETDKLKIFQ